MSWRAPVLVVVVVGAAFAATRWPQPAAADLVPVKPADKWEYGTLTKQNQPIWVEAGRVAIAKDWTDLAQQLGAPKGEKDGGDGAAQVVVLNHLGSNGWELVTHAATQRTDRQSGSSVYTFKRRVQ